LRKPQRRIETFVVTFTHEDEVLVRFEREVHTMVKFSVQYRAKIQGEWRPIVRFDTAHGYAHQDTSYPDGRQKTRKMKLDDYGVALTQALRDVKARWEFYRERYERWQDGT
jgi:hypothetical protein